MEITLSSSLSPVAVGGSGSAGRHRASSGDVPPAQPAIGGRELGVPAPGPAATAPGLVEGTAWQ